jgi:hypothetical protein
MSPAEKRVVKLAMEWYRRWNRTTAHPPTIASGHDLGEVPLHRACKALEYERQYVRVKEKAA